MKAYWNRHLIADPVIAGVLTGLLWGAPFAGIEAIWTVDPVHLSDLLSRWLAGNLTLIGLIIATTGFISSVLEKDEFSPLARSSSRAQLWEILRQNLGWLFLSAAYCFVGSVTHWESAVLQPFAVVGSFLGIIVAISLGKLVWVMRSVLKVRILNARKRP